jgi:hypothetical protein
MQEGGCEKPEPSARPEIFADITPDSIHVSTSMDGYAPSCILSFGVLTHKHELRAEHPPPPQPAAPCWRLCACLKASARL